MYNKLNQEYYITYTEQGNIDYSVSLKPNAFYEEDNIGKGQSYVAALIDNIEADFDYTLTMGTTNVAYDYSYGILAQLLVSDMDSGEPIYSPTYELVPEQRFSQNGDRRLTIREHTEIDYGKYDQLATEFTQVYGLKHSVSMLLVTMTVNVISQCDSFEEDSSNTYSISLQIPLVSETNTVYPQTVSSVPNGERHILAYVGTLNQNTFRLIGYISGVLAMLLLITLIVYACVTRNEDIRYEAKIKRILTNYRSFVQVISNEFNAEGYQTLLLSSFNEMLSIRDTIQSPILMCENEDKTCTQFLIPTHTKVLYVYEVKVENFDEIYGIGAEESTESEEPVLF
ncbi:MAG: hypothetical protein IJW69_00425 [Clostridia bacterium]|nr:hypothetical protein [Clostridia bacterium]